MEREAELENFMQTYNIQTTKKKRKKLLEMPEASFRVFTIGVEIAHCCKVRNLSVLLLKKMINIFVRS